MADDERIVAVGGQFTPRGVRDGGVVQRYAGFEGEGRDYGDGLVGYECRVGVFRLGGDSLYGI